ncbi:MAG: hypothetical protein V1881_03340 [Candidatus Micrarchaeota archaeon]
MRLKGFIFTADALFALSLVLLVAYVWNAVGTAAESEHLKYGQMRALGRDYLAMNSEGRISGDDFTAMTALKISNVAPKDAEIALRVEHRKYPPLCGGQTVVDMADACLKETDATDENSVSEAWVSR